MRGAILLALGLGLGLAPGPASSARAAEILVHAASSLGPALDEIARAHEQATGVRVRVNLAGSNALARQLRQGAPGDVFFSADEARMDEVQDAGLLAPGTRASLLSNRLVIVVEASSLLSLASSRDLARADVESVALAEPGSVPAGRYAREHLVRAGCWAAVEPKVLPCENARAALAAVEAGNADAAVVYRTDALASRRARIALEVPAAETPAISYPVALLAGAAEPDAARAFLARLASADSRAVFERLGFVVRR